MAQGSPELRALENRRGECAGRGIPSQAPDPAAQSPVAIGKPVQDEDAPEH